MPELSGDAAKIRDLEKVLALNAKINSGLPLDELLNLLMTTAAEVMAAHVSSLMLIDEKTRELVFKVALGEKGGELKEKFRIKMGEGIAGTVAQSGKSLVLNDVRNDKRFASRFDNSTGFVTKAMVCVPLKVRDKIIGVLQAINPLHGESFSEAALYLFENFAEQAAIAIESARLRDEMVRQEKARQELAIAHKIQQNFLPELKSGDFDLDIAAKNIPALQVGGDFYDVVRLDESRIGIVIGDVSGKGVPAALYMVRAISDYRMIAPQTTSAAQTLIQLNNRLARDSQFGIFVTLMCAILDRKKNTLCFASAGHHPILKRAKEGKIESLESAGGPPLGLAEGMDYAETSVKICAGDFFILYTDGLTEARNGKGEEYTIERVKKSAGDSAGTSTALAGRLLDELNQFVKDAPQHDDLTVLVFKT